MDTEFSELCTLEQFVRGMENNLIEAEREVYKDTLRIAKDHISEAVDLSCTRHGIGKMRGISSEGVSVIYHRADGVVGQLCKECVSRGLGVRLFFQWENGEQLEIKTFVR